MTPANSSSSDPAVAQVGQRGTVTITDVAFGGEGVARMGEFVVFVPFVIPGEDVLVEIIEVKRRFARAKLIEILKPSAQRNAPRCPYFGRCGGCQYQHVAYATQLELKQKQVGDLIRRIGGMSPSAVRPIIPCPRPYGYRNRLMIRSQWDKPAQRLNIGFLEHNSRLVVDVKECPIAEPELSDQIRQVHAQPPPKGGIKVVLRLMPEGWVVPPDSFFQNNMFLLPELTRILRESLGTGQIRHLIDVYCGVGFFALELADLVTSYAGVELDQRAIQAARQNAKSRSRTNGEFIAARAEDALPKLLEQFPAGHTALVLDPPRIGCAPELAEAIRATRPTLLLYVSCNPATLARDLNVLCADGVYELASLTPLDMFPQTQHVECVAELRATAAPLPREIN